MYARTHINTHVRTYVTHTHTQTHTEVILAETAVVTVPLGQLHHQHVQKHLNIPDAGHGCQNKLMGTTQSNIILKHRDVCLKLDTVVSDKQDTASTNRA